MNLSGHEGENPIPISRTYADSYEHNILHDSPPALHHHTPCEPPPLHASTITEDQHHHNNNNSHFNSKKGVWMKYKECLKNHAASIGANATDGCGEFMPSGEEGTLGALKCSACSCHRNFHRKEIEGEASSFELFNQIKGRKAMAMGQKGLLISGSDAFGYIQRPSSHNIIISRGGGALQTSESDVMEVVGGVTTRPPNPMMVKKRFRTKFIPEQKEKMLSFAEKAGWKLQKQEETVVQQLCQEIGIKRRAVKVWMHNNKYNLAKKSSVHQLQ